eukprot:4850793-Heterocapsa_arctica.AAC.1
MKTERNHISQYGAVRITKAEAIEMIRNNMRYQNFWIFVTVVEEDDDRSAKTMELGYKFYRDYSNECYGDYLRHTATN